MLSEHRRRSTCRTEQPGVTYLTLKPTIPRPGRRCSECSPRPTPQDSGATSISLIVYDPSSGGVGVALPVTVEQFTDLSLADAASPDQLRTRN